MKLRYIFGIILSAVLAFTSCEPSSIKESFDNIKLDKSYVAIDMAGTATTIKITATEAWAFDETKIPEWLDVNPKSGNAGETSVSFSATAAQDGRDVELTITAGKNTQFVKVLQGTKEVSPATCAEVNAGPDGKSYKVKGVCTNIVNTQYGNWYLKDDTGEIYIYGTLDKKGATKNFLSLGLEVGDVVEVQGPKTTYGTTVELVDVTVLSITKSLVKVEEGPTDAIAKEGGEFSVKLTYKGEGVLVSIPEESNWISLVSMDYKAGTPTKINPTPSDTVIVKFRADANVLGDRSGSVVFESKSGSKGSTVEYAISQKGSIIDANAKTINEAEDGETQYRLTGYISKVANTTYGNIYVTDATGEVYVYGVLNNGKSKEWEKLGINEGDIVTVVGPKTSYKGAPQMKNVEVEAFKAVKDITTAEFLTKSDDANTYYRMTGTIEGLKDGDLYGNFNIVDATGSAYVYGLLSGWGGPKKMFQELGLKNGDKVTIVGVKSSYKGSPQVGSAFFVSKAE